MESLSGLNPYANFFPSQKKYSKKEKRMQSPEHTFVFDGPPGNPVYGGEVHILFN